VSMAIEISPLVAMEIPPYGHETSPRAATNCLVHGALGPVTSLAVASSLSLRWRQGAAASPPR
jgi:hypothetical protein